MNEKQTESLSDLCRRYHVPFDEKKYFPGIGLPDGWVQGWIGDDKIFVGCSPEGDIAS